MAAVVLAGAAVIVAKNSLDDQQRINDSQKSINESQLSLNQYARDRQDRRYSSRVAFWWEKDRTYQGISRGDLNNGGFNLKVQNRSPALLRDASIVISNSYHLGPPVLGTSSGGRPANKPVSFPLGDVEPCVIVGFSTYATGSNPEENMWLYAVGGGQWELQFSDPVGLWGLSGNGLSRIDDKHFPGITIDEDPADQGAWEPKGGIDTAEVSLSRASDGCGEGG